MTLVYTNWSLISPGDKPLWIAFKDKSSFLSLQGSALSYCASDSEQVPRTWRELEGKLDFSGTIKYKWQELAKRLEKTLTSRLGVPERCLARYVPRALALPSELGPVGSKVPRRRVDVFWVEPNSPHRPVDDHGFGAEFDLQTGELKHIGFLDTRILKAIARAQGSRP
jgi:hypothetical protein